MLITGFYSPARRRYTGNVSEEHNPGNGTNPEAETLESVDTPSPSRGPKEIGHYKIRRVIGSDGMMSHSTGGWFAF
jgi:hypothetical protein